jgi:uncharacterized protein (DUF924 family)
VTELYDPLLEFWFGECREDPGKIGTRMQFWFAASSDDDHEIEDKFKRLYEQAVSGELRDWQQSPPGRLALILLLDQLPRCLFRGTPQAFSNDHQAASLCLAGIDRQVDLQLLPIERVFFYIPLQHVEDIAGQDAGVAAYQRLVDAQDDYRTTFENFRDYAKLHRDIIARFDRFPHRNTILDRENTAEEAEYLAGDAPSFGQSG